VADPDDAGLTIERLTSLDPDTLAELVEGGRAALGDSALDEWLLPVIAAHGFLFTVRVGESLAGSAEVLRSVGDGEIYLEGFYVLPAHQGKGLGGILLAEVINIFSSQGYQRMLATLDPGNGSAKALYARAGFLDVDLLPDHYGTGRDRLLLAVELTWDKGLT